MSIIPNARLLRKVAGYAFDKVKKQGICIPLEAASCDAVKVKKGKIVTDIFTFRDEQGKMISRYIKRKEGKNIIETTRKYDKLCDFDVDVTEDSAKTVWLNSKRIRSHTRSNGKISEIKEEVITHTIEKVPFMTKTTRTVKPEADCNPFFSNWKKPKYEAISIEQRKRGTNPKFIKNEYKLDEFVQGHFELLSSKVSSDELKEIAENSYLLPFTSTDSKFVHRFAQACIDEKDFVLKPRVILYKKAGKTKGFASDCGDEVSINIMPKEGLIEPRTSLVNTIGHEVGHAKWGEKTSLYEFKKKTSDSVVNIEGYTLEEIPKIKKYKKAIEEYTSPEENYKEYYSNFAEKTAREEGAAASEKYSDLESLLEKHFPFLHPNQFYVPKFEKMREEGLFEYLSYFRA